MRTKSHRETNPTPCADQPFRVHLADGSNVEISAPDAITARKRAEEVTDHRITKIKKVRE